MFIDTSPLVNDISLCHKVLFSGKPNLLGCRIPVASGLNIVALRKLALGYADSEALDFMEFGFPISHDGRWFASTGKVTNHKGALDFPKAVDTWIADELGREGLLGPFDHNPLDVPLAVAPLNTVPKSDGVSRRIIANLSQGGVNSVNGGVDKDFHLGEEYHLVLPTIDNIVALINKRGTGCLLFKRDLARAYRQFPVDPGDWNKLGIFWRNKFYIDKRLAMGLRSAGSGCQRCTLVIGFIFSSRCSSDLEVYLDDFNGVCDPIPEQAQADFKSLGDIFDEVGLAESVDKAVSPGTRRVILGILFDTVSMTMEVTQDRLKEIVLLTHLWSSKNHATKKQVQQILGKLVFICKCVRQGRVFLNRLLSFLRSFGDANQNKVLKIPEDATLDIKWFNRFLEHFNGVSMIPGSVWSAPDTCLATDACLVGAGGVCQLQCFHTVFPAEILNKPHHITELEMRAVTVAIKLWAPLCKGHNITVYCDNEPTVSSINSGKARNPAMHSCLRELVFVSATTQCQVRAVHIEGVFNRLPDFLSRWELGMEFRKKFWREAPTGMKVVSLPSKLFNFAHDW